MAFTLQEQVDFLWKRLQFGTTKTAASTDKLGSNETIPSPLPVLPSSVWKDADLIPVLAPNANTPIIKVHKGAARIGATSDPTSAPNLTWLATATKGDVNTRLTGFIPPTFGATYAVKVYIGDPDGGPAARIFPDTTGEEWMFDYAAGVLIFGGTIPSNKPASIGSGNVSVSTHGIFFEVCRYDGATGVGDPAAKDGFELPLGGQSAWTGAVNLDDNLSISEAIDLLNVKLGDVETQAGAAPRDGFGMPLGDIMVDGDGSWSGGAVQLDNSVPVSEAIDRVNEVLGKLVPAAPPNFPNGVLTISNTAGSTPLLASGAVPDNTGASPYTAGAAVSRVSATGISCSAFNDVGPGDSGKVAVLINAAETASKVLTGTGDAGTFSGLVIADQKDFPLATPGFYKSIDVSMNLVAVPVGVNKVKISHSGAGQTGEVFFLRDSLTATPALSGLSMVEAAAGTVAYSSSVPHYNTGATLTVGASMTNLAGETYYGGADPITVSGQNGVISSQSFGYAALGVTTPIARQTLTATALTPVTVNVDGATHGAGKIQVNAKNVNGASGAADAASTIVLVKRGAPGAKIDEATIAVSGLGSAPNTNPAKRVGTAAGDTPAGAVTAWDPAAALPAHEAAVVAGVAKHDQTNYSTGYLPAGPDLSTGRTGAQYITESFQRAARSTFKINVTGSYAGCWVRLPGVTDNPAIAPNAVNGWMDATKLYDGAGVPGKTGDAAAGCALGSVMNGGSGAFSITFGTQSSTNATGNEIQVHFKLNAGQSITALSFSN